MSIKFGLTKELVNTQYAPLAALIFHYEHAQTLKPLEWVLIPINQRLFTHK